MRKALLKIYSLIPQPRFTRFRNLSLFEWMNENAPGKKVLNLGSGVRAFDNHLSGNIHAVNLDIDSSKPDLDVVADAHNLPFRNQSFHIVYSIAVLEHVRKPWIVADEIARILCSGGYVVLEVPFLNVIHDEEDYFRFTDKGIRSLFDESNFDVILEQVGSGGGSFLSVFLYRYIGQFIPTRIFKALWQLFGGYPLSLCKYFDVVLHNNQELRFTANSFSFIGRKK